MNNFTERFSWIIFILLAGGVVAALVWFFQSPGDLYGLDQLHQVTDVALQLLAIYVFAGVASMASSVPVV